MLPHGKRAIFFYALPVLAAGIFTVSILQAQTNDPMPTPVRYSFEYYDMNSNGVLDPEELSHYVFRKWDRDANGFLDDGEWNFFVPGWRQPFTDTKIPDYSYWDNDNDGRLRSEDVRIMFQDTGFLFLWDENNDGIVDRRELSDALVQIHRHDDSLVDPYEWKIFLD